MYFISHNRNRAVTRKLRSGKLGDVSRMTVVLFAILFISSLRVLGDAITDLTISGIVSQIGTEAMNAGTNAVKSGVPNCDTNCLPTAKYFQTVNASANSHWEATDSSTNYYYHYVLDFNASETRHYPTNVQSYFMYRTPPDAGDYDGGYTLDSVSGKYTYT